MSAPLPKSAFQGGTTAPAIVSDRAVCCPQCHHVFQRPAIYREDWSRDDRRRLKELHGRGLTFAQIAREMGRTRSAIAGKVKRLGLTRGAV